MEKIENENLSQNNQNIEPLLTPLINKINDLYIMTRYKYLSMFKDNHSNKSLWSTNQKWSLNDYHIKKHLLQDSTIGVFSGQELTKFLCFDIDSPSLVYSKQLAHLLNYTLVDVFNVPKDYIYTSFSGKKGYHVEIFFTEALSLSLAKSFHEVVIDFIHNNSEETIYGEIEFRPTFTQGVKLPLSIHKETGNLCSYVDNDTLQVIEDIEYILSIKKLDVDLFKSKVLDSLICDITEDNYFTLETKKSVTTENLFNEIKPYSKLENMYIEENMSILEENHLIKNGTRHKVSLNLSIYLKNTGKTLEESISIINSIMNNTYKNYRHLIDKETSYEYMIKEVERLCRYVYKKGVVNSKKGSKPNKSGYRLYKKELIKILEIETKPLRKLMFSLYIQSKKYSKTNGEFYMSYSVISKMGNDRNSSRILQQLLKLEEKGFIEIVQRNKTNKAMTIEANKQNIKNKSVRISETNIYKVLIENSEEDNQKDTYINVGLEDNVDLVSTIVSLIPEKETKKKLSSKQFYSEYKTEYKKANK